MRQVYENLLNKNVLPHTVAEWYVHREHEVLRSALHVAMCAAMSETQDRLQNRKEHLQAICLQPDGHLGHLL